MIYNVWCLKLMKTNASAGNVRKDHGVWKMQDSSEVFDMGFHHHDNVSYAFMNCDKPEVEFRAVFEREPHAEKTSKLV